MIKKVEKGVEFNLLQYLQTEIPALNYSVNGYGPTSPEDCIMIQGDSGEINHWYDRKDWQVQIISRAASRTGARVNSYTVFEKLKNRFGLELPDVTVDGELFEGFKTYQISPIQSPGYIGSDEAGREMFSFNITLTTE